MTLSRSSLERRSDHEFPQNGRPFSSDSSAFHWVNDVCQPGVCADLPRKRYDTEQIKALDREKTVVLLPGGILEEHGSYLPSFSDGYSAKRRTEDLANAIVERPRWKALIFPLIPLGSVGANILGQKYVFPGSYTVRPSTLRAIFIVLATELGEQGFRWIFVVQSHGGLDHNPVLNQAGDYFHDSYGGT